MWVMISCCSRQFKHMRMTDSANVEISNPMYMRDYEDEEGGDVAESFTLDPDKVRTHFGFLQVDPNEMFASSY